MRTSDVKGQAARRPPAGRLDLDLLELFDRVYRLRNLTAAAAQLGLTQPAVSRGLARLRAVYGDALFVRQQRGVLPTPYADQLANPLAQALAIVRGTVERPWFDPATDRRSFRVAMSDIGERFFLPRLTGHLGRLAPHVTLESVTMAVPELKASMEAGGIDLIAGYLPDLGKQVHQRRLFCERFVYVARGGHPAVHGRLRREQLRELPHVLASPPGWPHAAAIERALGGPRVRAPIGLRVRSFLCIPAVVAETDAVAVMPSNLAALVAGPLQLQVVESPVQIPGFDISVAWHDRYHRDPGIAWMREQFIALFQVQERAGAASRA